MNYNVQVISVYCRSMKYFRNITVATFTSSLVFWKCTCWNKGFLNAHHIYAFPHCEVESDHTFLVLAHLEWPTLCPFVRKCSENIFVLEMFCNFPQIQRFDIHLVSIRHNCLSKCMTWVKTFLGFLPLFVMQLYDWQLVLVSYALYGNKKGSFCLNVLFGIIMLLIWILCFYHFSL